MVWSAGALPKRRRIAHTVRDRAFLLGPAGMCEGEWIALAAAPVTAYDVEAWPYFVGMLVKLVTFFWTLHWPASCLDLGVGGVSFVEILIFMSFWLGRGLSWKRPFLGIGGLDVKFQCRLFRLVQALIFGVRGHSFRALRAMPGGIGRFTPCDVGANHCRLRHIRWEKSGHGLTSRPRESASEGVLDELLVLFRYPPRSAAVLWEVLFLFGTVQGGFLIGSPLGTFLVVGMLLVWLLMIVEGMLLSRMSTVFLWLCQLSGVMLGLTGLVVLVEALKESD